MAEDEGAGDPAASEPGDQAGKDDEMTVRVEAAEATAEDADRPAVHSEPPDGGRTLDGIANEFARWLDEARRQRDSVVDSAKAEARALLEHARDQVRSILEEVEEQRRQAQAHSDAVREHAEAGAAQRLAEADRILTEAQAARELYARKEAALRASINRLAQDAERLGREALEVAGKAQSALHDYPHSDVEVDPEESPRRPDDQPDNPGHHPDNPGDDSEMHAGVEVAHVAAGNGHSGGGPDGEGMDHEARWSFWRGSRRPE